MPVDNDTKKWVLISKDEPLDPGDRIRMYYDVIGPTYLVAAQIAAIEKKLQSNPQFTLIATSLPQEGGWLREVWFELLINKPADQTQTPTIQTASISGSIIAIIIASAFVITSVFCWLSFREIRRMEIGPKAKEIIKETGWTALKIGAAAIIGVIALKWWSK